MPTTLPNRTRVEAYDLTACGIALLRFYVVIGLAVVLLIATEAGAGLFQGLTAAEAILQATGTELASGEIAIVWTRPSM